MASRVPLPAGLRPRVPATGASCSARISTVRESMPRGSGTSRPLPEPARARRRPPTGRPPGATPETGSAQDGLAQHVEPDRADVEGPPVEVRERERVALPPGRLVAQLEPQPLADLVVGACPAQPR